jgi:catechol 2,3-dioxygenase-like lactoylglutathione lyase family enzyme
MTPDPQPMLSGVNHVAVLTEDLDRFLAFYTEVFDLQVVFREDTPAFRHAIVRTGPESWLHPVQVDGNPHGTAIPAMFERGHLDHLAVTAASPEAFAAIRARLRERGLHDGAVDDLGAFHSIWFEDPDGMRVEVVLVVDPELRGIHEPRPLAAAAAGS